MNNKFSVKFLSVVLTFAFALLMFSTVAIAGDGEAGPNGQPLTAEDIFRMIGDTVYSCGDMTFSAVTDGGAPSGIKIKYPPQSTTMPVSSFEFICEGGVYRLSRDNRPQMSLADFDYDFLTITFNVSGDTVESVEILGSGMSVTMPDGEFYYDDYDGVYMASDGTEEHPWQIGDGAYDNVYAYVSSEPDTDGLILYVKGEGAMRDFDELSQRPWDAMASEIKGCEIGEEITRIGNNSFKNLGDGEWFGLYLYLMDAGLQSIGDSAFEGLTLDGNVISVPEGICSIGSRAFANAGGVGLIDFFGTPSYIAEDAFENSSFEVFVVFNEWTDEEKRPYGGNITYNTMFRFECEDDYGVDEISGTRTAYYIEGETVDYPIEPADDAYHFVRWEVLEGNFEISDPTNPELKSEINDNVRVKAIFELNSGETDDPTDDPTRPGVTVPTQVIIIIIVSIIVAAAVTVTAVIYITRK